MNFYINIETISIFSNIIIFFQVHIRFKNMDHFPPSGKCRGNPNLVTATLGRKKLRRINEKMAKAPSILRYKSKGGVVACSSHVQFGDNGNKVCFFHHRSFNRLIHYCIAIHEVQMCRTGCILYKCPGT